MSKAPETDSKHPCVPSIRNDSLGHTVPLGQPLLHVHRLHPEQHRAHPTPQDHPGLRLRYLFHPLRSVLSFVCTPCF